MSEEFVLQQRGKLSSHGLMSESMISFFLSVNIYAPNKVQDQCQFFDNLNKKIEDFVVNKEHRIILGGDLNVVFV